MGTIVEDGEAVGGSEGGLLLADEPDEVGLVDELYDFEGSAEVSFVAQFEGLGGVNFEADGSGEGDEGAIGVVGDGVDGLFGAIEAGGGGVMHSE